MHNNVLPSLDTKTKGATAAGLTVIDLDYTLITGAFTLFFFVKFGATVTVAAGTPAVRVWHADAADYSDKEEITALNQPIVAGMVSKQVCLELVKPTKKYVRLEVDRSGAGNSIIIDEQMIQAYYSRKLPEALSDNADDYVRSTKLCPASS